MSSGKKEKDEVDEFLTQLNVFLQLSQRNRTINEALTDRLQYLIATFIDEYLSFLDVKKSKAYTLDPSIYTVFDKYDKFIKAILLLNSDPSKNMVKKAFEFLPQRLLRNPHNPKKIDIDLFLKTVNDIKQFKKRGTATIIESENMISQSKLFENYKIVDLYIALLSPEPEKSLENMVSLMVFLQFLSNISYYESQLTSTEAQQDKEITLRDLVAEEEAKKAKQQAKQQAAEEAEARQKEQAEQAKQEREAAAAAEAAARAKEEEARARAEEEKQKAIQNQRNQARQAAEQAMRNKENAEFLAKLPAYIPKTNKSSWTKVKSYVPPPPGFIFKGDYHKEDVCERNFGTLAQKLIIKIRDERYYDAYIQLQECIDQRQSKYDTIRAEKKGKAPDAADIRHLNIINGLRDLLQEFKTGTMDTIQDIQFGGTHFILTRTNNQVRQFKVYGGSLLKAKKAKTKKAKRSKVRKTRKH